MKLTAHLPPFVLALAFGLASSASAQSFNFDRLPFPPQALLTFRQDGAANEMVVNLGPVNRFYDAAPGSRTVLNDYPATLLVSATDPAACFSTLDGIRFSVLATIRATEATNRPLQTIWVTRARSSDAPEVQTTPWPRRSQSSLGLSAAKVANIGVNATSRGTAADPGPRNATNRIVYPSALSGGLNSNLGSVGNLSATMPGTVEAIAPSGFADSGKTLRADFYEVRPSSVANDPSLYLGYFELSANGSLAFVAAGGSVTPPAAPVIRSISRNGNTSSVVVSTEAGARYSLARIDPSGAWTPVAQWPVVGAEVAGTGGDVTLTDASGSEAALYAVRASR
jgi:hypothetical protein